MVQAIDVPILEIPSIQKAMTIDELSFMWNVFSKCKNSIENGRRLENLSWRLWYRESSLQHHHHHSSSVSTCSTFGPATLNDDHNNTTMDIQINNHYNENNESTNINNNIIHLTENKEITKEEIPYQLSNQQSRKSKFFVDNSDTEDEDDDDEEEEEEEDEDKDKEENNDDDDMWSTFESNHEGKQYLEEAYQKKFTLSSLSTISTMTTATTLDEDDNEEDMENVLKSSLHYNHHQCLSSKPIFHQQQTSLLSKLFKQQQQQQQKVTNPHYDIPPELPPTLQSCVDWEKTQNMIIPCKLGQSPILPDENIIW
ncbi:unnamed protein product [Cunninghamella echinulata]